MKVFPHCTIWKTTPTKMEQAWHSWFPFFDDDCIPSNKLTSSLPFEVLWFSNGFQHFGGPSCLHFQSWNKSALKTETAALFEKFLYKSICQTVRYRISADTDKWLTLALCSEPECVGPYQISDPWREQISETLCSHEYSRWWKRRYQEDDQHENLVVVLFFSYAVPIVVGWSKYKVVQIWPGLICM